MSEEFDDIIRQKFAEKEFIFNEANWEKAEMKIDAAIRLKKILWWTGIFSVGLITGICVMFLWKKDKHAELVKPTNANLITKIEKNQKDISEPSLTNTTNTIEIYSTKNSTVDQANTTLIAKQTNQPSYTKGEEIATSAASEKGINTGKTNTTLSVSNRNNSTEKTTAQNHLKNSSNAFEREYQNKKKKNELLVTASTQKNNTLSVTQNTFAEKHIGKRGKRASTSVSAKEKPETTDGSSSFVPSGDKTKNKTVKKASVSTVSKKEKTPLNKKVEPTKKAETAKKFDATTKSLIANDSTKTTSGNAQDSTIALNDELNKLSLNDSVKVLALSDSLEKKNDSVPNLAKVADPISPLGIDGPASINLLSLDAGINGQIGWRFLNQKEANGFTPVFGIGIIHYFNQKWSVKAGLQYSTISNLKDNTSSLTTYYSFGSTVQTVVFKQKTLRYIGIPLFIQYHVNEKNSIFAGVDFSYLINNKIKVETSQNYMIASSINQTQGATSDTRPGYYNKIDAALAAGFRRKLIAHFSIAPVFYFGLMDIKKDSQFNLVQFERNSGIKLILSYTIFDF